jgi:hypothetical protein
VPVFGRVAAAIVAVLPAALVGIRRRHGRAAAMGALQDALQEAVRFRPAANQRRPKS